MKKKKKNKTKAIWLFEYIAFTSTLPNNSKNKVTFCAKIWLIQKHPNLLKMSHKRFYFNWLNILLLVGFEVIFMIFTWVNTLHILFLATNAFDLV